MEKDRLQSIILNILPLILLALSVMERNLVVMALAIMLFFGIKIYETLLEINDELHINNHLLAEALEEDDEDYDEDEGMKRTGGLSKLDDADDQTWNDLMENLKDTDEK